MLSSCQAKIIEVLENSSAKRKGHMDADKMAFLNAWRRIECRTREALRRSFLPELVEGFEVCFFRQTLILLAHFSEFVYEF